jgi:DNA-binding NarL/FixJ family response regulator
VSPAPYIRRLAATNLGDHRNEPRTALIVDDHAGFRDAARAVVQAAGLDVVGEIGDGERALYAVRALAPDVVLLDVRLPGLDGIAVAELLAVHKAPPRVVIMSCDDAKIHGARLERAPIEGFIPKQQLTRNRLAAILGLG